MGWFSKKAPETSPPVLDPDEYVPLEIALKWLFRHSENGHFYFFAQHGSVILEWVGPEGAQLELGLKDVTEAEFSTKVCRLVAMAMAKDRSFYTRLTGDYRDKDLWEEAIDVLHAKKETETTKPENLRKIKRRTR